MCRFLNVATALCAILCAISYGMALVIYQPITVRILRMVFSSAFITQSFVAVLSTLTACFGRSSASLVVTSEGLHQVVVKQLSVDVS